MTTVLTGIFGQYDNLVAPPIQTVDADWICVTDRGFDAPEPWRVMVLDDGHPAMQYEHPRDRTVWCKTQPWMLTYDPELIWIDANSILATDRFVEQASAYSAAGFATYAHPDRDCVYDEARAALAIHPAKYADQPLLEQVAHYRTRGHPSHGGLYAVGTIVYDTSRDDVRELCSDWLAECERWSYQTQLSLPYVARLNQFPIATFDHHQIVGNPWMTLGRHNANT